MTEYINKLIILRTVFSLSFADKTNITILLIDVIISNTIKLPCTDKEIRVFMITIFSNFLPLRYGWSLIRKYIKLKFHIFIWIWNSIWILLKFLCTVLCVIWKIYRNIPKNIFVRNDSKIRYISGIIEKVSRFHPNLCWYLIESKINSCISRILSCICTLSK